MSHDVGFTIDFNRVHAGDVAHCAQCVFENVSARIKYSKSKIERQRIAVRCETALTLMGKCWYCVSCTFDANAIARYCRRKY